VQGVIKEHHKKKIIALFIRLDISKAFDTVCWPYLLDIMAHFGFGQKWRNWISSLWCIASSSILVNGVPGRKVHHYRGIRQGGPLSHMMYLLAMEPLHMLFRKAQEAKLINKLSPNCDSFKVSLYTDDAALFLNPAEQELVVLNHIIKLFADASGLQTNLSKTQFYPVQCQEVDLDFLARAGQPVSMFPCSYMGLALHTKRLNRAALHPFIQKIGDRLPGWK
jgi:hypothetical protein